MGESAPVLAMSLHTALEILNNYNDLQIFIGSSWEGEEKKFGPEAFSILITRGEGHNFKPLISVDFQQSAASGIVLVEDAVKRAVEILRLARTTVETLLMSTNDDDKFLVALLGLNGGKLDDYVVLDETLITKIENELTEKRIASTWELYSSETTVPA